MWVPAPQTQFLNFLKVVDAGAAEAGVAEAGAAAEARATAEVVVDPDFPLLLKLVAVFSSTGRFGRGGKGVDDTSVSSPRWCSG